VAPEPENIGHCDACGVDFRYAIYHNGFNASSYGYCDSCGRTLILSAWSEAAKRIPLKIYQPIEDKIMPLLKSCPCGGRFSNAAKPRCPSCHSELSAEAATVYIERNAPGTVGGWRWQRSWDGIYCIDIGGRAVYDWWDEEKPGGNDAARL